MSRKSILAAEHGDYYYCTVDVLHLTVCLSSWVTFQFLQCCILFQFLSKASTNETFRLSKQKVSRLRVCQYADPILNHDSSCQPVGVKRSDIWFLFWLKWKEIFPQKSWAEILITQALLLDGQSKSDTWKRYSSYRRRWVHLIGGAVKK